MQIGSYIAHSGPDPVFSPDGKYVAYARDFRLLVRPADEENGIRAPVQTFGCLDQVEGIQWSPACNYLMAVMTKRSMVQIWRVTPEDVDDNGDGDDGGGGSNPAATLTEGPAGIAAAWWSPKGTHLVLASEFGLRLTVWYLATNTCKHLNPGPKWLCSSLPPPSLFEKDAVLKDAQRWGEQLQQWEGGEGGGAGGRWGVDFHGGSQVMVVAERQACKDAVAVYDASPGKGPWQLLARFRPGTADLGGMAISPDGVHIALWEGPLTYRLLLVDLSGATHLDFRPPDGSSSSSSDPPPPPMTTEPSTQDGGSAAAAAAAAGRVRGKAETARAASAAAGARVSGSSMGGKRGIGGSRGSNGASSSLSSSKAAAVVGGMAGLRLPRDPSDALGIAAVAWSPGGSLLAVANHNGTGVRVFCSANWGLMAHLRLHPQVTPPPATAVYREVMAAPAAEKGQNGGSNDDGDAYKAAADFGVEEEDGGCGKENRHERAQGKVRRRGGSHNNSMGGSSAVGFGGGFGSSSSSSSRKPRSRYEVVPLPTALPPALRPSYVDDAPLIATRDALAKACSITTAPKQRRGSVDNGGGTAAAPAEAGSDGEEDGAVGGIGDGGGISGIAPGHSDAYPVQLAWSGRGELLSLRSAAYPTALHVWRASSLALAAVLLHPRPITCAAWAPATTTSGAGGQGAGADGNSTGRAANSHGSSENGNGNGNGLPRLLVCTRGADDRFFLLGSGGASCVHLPLPLPGASRGVSRGAWSPAGDTCAVTDGDTFCCAYLE